MKKIESSLIIQRLKKAYNLKTNNDLANFLNKKAPTISSWKKRNSIDWDLIFSKCGDLNINWLVTGKGSMLLNADEKPLVIKEPDISYKEERRNGWKQSNIHELVNIALHLENEQQIRLIKIASLVFNLSMVPVNKDGDNDKSVDI